MLAITGATGHLGQTLLRQLRTRDEDVTAAVRAGSDRHLLEGLCRTIVEAPLDDAEGLKRAFDGADAVIHAAALIDIRRGRMREMRRTNVEGTENVIEACRAAGVRRLVYLSSVEALDLHTAGRPVTEEAGLSGGDAVMEYGDTKAEATRLVVEAGRSGALETVSLCPTGIIGPWDYKGGLFTTMIKRFLAGRMPASIPGGFDFVDVRDAAGGVLSAIDRGRSGEMYLLSGEVARVSDLFGALQDISGKRGPRVTLPLWLARAAGEASEAYSRMTGRRALFTRGSIDILQMGMEIDDAKAGKELGYASRPVRDALADTVEWLRRGTEVNPAPIGI